MDAGLAFFRDARLMVGFLFLALLSTCQTQDRALTLELQRSFKNFLNAVESRDETGLTASVYFPGAASYSGHVRELILNYLDQVQTEKKVVFDPQGVTLCRFLQLNHHTYLVKRVSKSEDGMKANMRISVGFSYDSSLAYSIRNGDYEPGTRVYIPGKPWGAVIELVVGEPLAIPREQLKYLEIDLTFKKTNYEGLWQIRTCQADESSIQYEVSLKDDF